MEALNLNRKPKELTQEEKLDKLFSCSNIKAKVKDTKVGLRTKTFYVELEIGEKTSKIKKLKEEIILVLNSLSEPRIYLEPKMGCMAIETTTTDSVISIPFSDIFNCYDKDVRDMDLPCLLGKDMDGNIARFDLASAPHVLIGGTTGSGKSVLTNVMVSSLYKYANAYKSKANMILLDPKGVALQGVKDDIERHWNVEEILVLFCAIRRFQITSGKDLTTIFNRQLNQINHKYESLGLSDLPIKEAFIKIIKWAESVGYTFPDKDKVAHMKRLTNDYIKKEKRASSIYHIKDSKTISSTLSSLVNLMEDRFEHLEEIRKTSPSSVVSNLSTQLPDFKYFLVVIDELADILLSSKGKEDENNLTRLLQKAREVGIHIVMNTQRPSSDVVPGLIKACTPVQIALKTATSRDSRVILEEVGAEKLVGKGDLLLSIGGKITRIQSAYL